MPEHRPGCQRPVTGSSDEHAGIDDIDGFSETVKGSGLRVTVALQHASGYPVEQKRRPGIGSPAVVPRRPDEDIPANIRPRQTPAKIIYSGVGIAKSLQ